MAISSTEPGWAAWTPRVCAALAFAFYALCVPPGTFWLDSGELSAAAWQLGSPHPSGFPLYVFAGKLAALIPVGEIGFRLNLLSAICASLAVLWVARLVIVVGGEDTTSCVAGVGAGLTLALSLTFMRQATVAEVYTPTAALLAGTALTYHRVARGGDARSGLAFVVVLGIGTALHGTYRLLVPLPVLIMLWVRLRRGARWPLAAPAMVVLITGGLYALLAVRSASGKIPLIDWGHPATLGALVDHVRAKDILDAFGYRTLSSDTSVIGSDGRAFFATVFEQLGPAVLALAAGGLYSLVRGGRDAWLAFYLATVLVGDIVFSVWLHPYGITELQNGVPFAVAAATLAGIGSASFARFATRRAERWSPAPFLAFTLSVFIAVPAALVAVPEVWRSRHSDVPGLWAEHALDAAPPRAIALVVGDSTASTALYAQVVEGSRRDVAVVVRQQVGDVRKTLAALEQAGLPAPAGPPTSAALESLGAPMVWEPASEVPTTGSLVGGAPLYRIDRRGRRESAEATLGYGAALEAMFSRRHGDADVGRRELAQALTQLGIRALRRGHGPGAMKVAARLLDRAAAIDPKNYRARVNRGVVYSMEGDLERAAAVTRQAVELQPNYRSARINLGRYLLNLDRVDEAASHLERALGLWPKNADAMALLGVCRARQKDYAEARRLTEAALAVDPEQRDARRTLRALGKRGK